MSEGYSPTYNPDTPTYVPLSVYFQQYLVEINGFWMFDVAKALQTGELTENIVNNNFLEITAGASQEIRFDLRPNGFIEVIQ